MDIESLPDDILVKVFSNLSLVELVENVRHTSTRWSILSRDFYLWRTVRIGQNEAELQSIINAILEMANLIEEMTVDCGIIHEFLVSHLFRFTKLTRLRLLKFYSADHCVDLIAACPLLQFLAIRTEDGRYYRLMKVITQFEGLRHIAISQLLLTDCCMTGLRGCTLACFPFLNTLIIDSVEFPDSVINDIYKGSPLLKTLHLEDVNLSRGAFTNMPGHCDCLEELSLGGEMKLTEKDVIFIIGNLPNLRSLSLYSHQNYNDVLTERVIVFIAQSCHMLESLCIYGLSFNVTEAGIYALLRYCTHLRKLCFRYTSEAEYENISIEYEHFRTLEHLELPRCSFSDESIIFLKQNAVNLSVLEFGRSVYITGFAMSQIIINCRRLVHLSVTSCNTELDLNFDEFYEKNTPFGRKPLNTCNGACYRRDDKFLPLVQSIGVQNHCCSVDHDTHLERRPVSSRLKFITFCATRVTNRSVIQIAKHCPDLETFSTTTVDVYDDAAEALVKNCQCLRSLRLSGMNLSDAGLRAIATYGSNLRILEIFTSRGCIGSIDSLISKCKYKIARMVHESL